MGASVSQQANFVFANYQLEQCKCEGDGKGTSRESIRREVTANEIQRCNAVHLVRTGGLALCKTYAQSVRTSMSSGPLVERALAMAIVFLLLQFSFTLFLTRVCRLKVLVFVCSCTMSRSFACLFCLAFFFFFLLAS